MRCLTRRRNTLLACPSCSHADRASSGDRTRRCHEICNLLQFVVRAGAGNAQSQDYPNRLAKRFRVHFRKLCIANRASRLFLELAHEAVFTKGMQAILECICFSENLFANGALQERPYIFKVWPFSGAGHKSSYDRGVIGCSDNGTATRQTVLAAIYCTHTRNISKH